MCKVLIDKFVKEYPLHFDYVRRLKEEFKPYNLHGSVEHKMERFFV